MKQLQVVSITMILLALFFAGCSSSLKTYDAKQQPTVGIPINTPILVKVTERTSYMVDPRKKEFEGLCTPSLNTTFQYHVLGNQNYITFTPALLGKGEFKIEFYDNGALKSVSLNSDASTGIDKINDLVKTVAPYVAAPLGLARETKAIQEETAQSMKDKYCLKTQSEVISIEQVKYAE